MKLFDLSPELEHIYFIGHSSLIKLFNWSQTFCSMQNSVLTANNFYLGIAVIYLAVMFRHSVWCQHEHLRCKQKDILKLLSWYGSTVIICHLMPVIHEQRTCICRIMKYHFLRNTFFVYINLSNANITVFWILYNEQIASSSYAADLPLGGDQWPNS